MALIGKFGIGGAIDKILSAGDIDSPKAESAIEKLESSRIDAVSRIMDLLETGPKINQSLLTKLLDRLLDNSTIGIVMDQLMRLDAMAQKDIISLVSKSRAFDPHMLLPYLKEPLPKQTRKNLLMAHRRHFTGVKLLRSIGKTDPELWETLFELIHGSADEAILPEAVATSRSKNPVLRSYITQLISEFKGAAASEALLLLAFDDDKGVREKAIIGLTRQKADIPAKDLMRMLHHAEGKELQLIKILLKNCKDIDLGKYLVKILLSKNVELTEIIMQVLGDIINEHIIRDILQGLEGKDPWVKEDIITALSEKGGDRYISAVGKLTKDDDEAIRAIALEALEQGDINNPAVLDSLRESLNTDDYLSKQNAIRKLGEAKDTQSVDKLLSIMANDPRSATAVLEALGNIGDSRALPDVFDLLNSSEIQLQRSALECLPKLITDQYATGVRDQLIAHANKLHVAVGQTLIETLESLTASFGLARDSAYNNSLKKIVQDLSADKEKFVESDNKDVSESDPIMSLEVGMDLGGRYKLVREIGRGGYGSVWLVKDTIIDEELVMKFLHAELVTDGIAAERFIREVRLARKVTHPNIIRLHDYLSLDKVSAISMEYFDGYPLSDEIHKGAIEIHRAIKMLKMMCDALQAAHEVEVIHRDLKPANILLNDEDTIKIVDFGIAAASKQAESRLTRTGTLVGTPTYISPEQIQGKKVDGRTDMYSLGIIMYEMLTGAPPYVADDPMALVFMHVEGKARRIEDVNPLVPTELADIIHRCMAPSPEDRFQDMNELGRAFDQVEID